MKIKEKQNKGLYNSNKREGRKTKDFVPLSSKEVRVNNSIKIPHDISKLPVRNFTSHLSPTKIFPEWPSNEEIKVKNYKFEIFCYYFKIKK